MFKNKKSNYKVAANSYYVAAIAWCVYYFLEHKTMYITLACAFIALGSAMVVRYKNEKDRQKK